MLTLSASGNNVRLLPGSLNIALLMR